MILNIILTSLLVSSSALTLPQKVVPAPPAREKQPIHGLHDRASQDKVQEAKETTFSFTREVLQAWKHGRSAVVPRLKFAAEALRSPDLATRLHADNSALPSTKLEAAGEIHHGFAYDAALEIARQSRQLRSAKTNVGTQSVKRTISQAPSLSPEIPDVALPEGVVRIYGAHEFMTNKNHTGEVPNTRSSTGVGHMLEFVPPVAYQAAGISEKKADLVAMLFVVAVLVLISCCVAVLADFDPSDYGMEQKDLGHSSSHTTLKTLGEMLEALENTDGTWAQNYKVAEGKRKMALELVFRCNIIPEQEFAHSRVSQEHIDECIWIAVNMLSKRSVEEWVDRWVEARVTFNESVTACFQARTELMDPGQPSSFASRSPPSPAYNQAFSPPRQHSQEEAVLSKDRDGQNLLVVRCREIMASQLKRSRSPGSDELRSPKAVEKRLP